MNENKVNQFETISTVFELVKDSKFVNRTCFIKLALFSIVLTKKTLVIITVVKGMR